jgi:tetratricopeptide (TPR) repeat protein
LNRSDEEIAAYDEAMERFGDSDEAEVKQEVADALFAKAASLEKKQRLDEAIATYDQLVQKYEAAPEIELQARVARALLAKGAGLGDLGKTDEEMKLYDLVIQRYGPTPDLQNETALAVFSKAYRLAKLDEGDAAIALYDHIINKFGTSTDPELGGIVAKARFNKSNALGATHRIEEALAVCTEIIETYSTSSDPMLLEIASDTLNSMAFNLLILAKADRLSGNEAAALSKLQSAEGYIVKSLEKDADNPMKLGNQGYIAFLLGRKDEARRLLTRAITLGGEKIRQGELNDAFINELPEDPKFRELVNSIPLPV